MSSIETRLDGSTLIVRIPMRYQRRGGRKRIVAPDGSAILPATKPQPDGTLVKALARAWRWQRLLESEGSMGPSQSCRCRAGDSHPAGPRPAPPLCSPWTSSNGVLTGARHHNWRS